MESILERLGTRLYRRGDHTGYLVKSDVVKAIVKKWRGNREPEQARVLEICEYLRQHPSVPTISVALLSDSLQCYDGNHRREAVALLDEPFKVPVILDVLECPRGEADVAREFLALNKTVPVSELHLASCGGGSGGEQQQSSSELADITALVRSYEARFKPFVSTSHRCNPPNFNRDRFTDNVFRLTTSTGRTVQEIAAALERLNELYNPNVRPLDADHPIVLSYSSHKISDRVREKCERGGLWLFARSHEVPIIDMLAVLAQSSLVPTQQYLSHV